MITFFAYAMVIIFMVLIMWKKMTPFSALVLVPLVFTIVGGLLGIFDISVEELGDMALQGVQDTATTGIMLLFAILFFSIMVNVGVFDPVTNAVIRISKGDPCLLLVGTAFVAAAVSLSGDATTTFLITGTTLLPVFRKLKLNIMNFGIVVILMNTIMNLLPWGGPTARVIGVMDINEQEILRVLAPGMLLAFIYMMAVSYYLGLKERKRLGVAHLSDEDIEQLVRPADTDPKVEELKRPKLIWINALLTLAIVTMLVAGTLPSVVLFLVGTALALVINYKSLKMQRQRISDNAGDAVQVVILILAAGIFMGFFNGTGMAEALSLSITTVIPESFGSFWGLIIALLSAPGTFFLSNDAFYFGVLPVLAEAGTQYGFTALEMAAASLLGQAFHLLSPLVAAIYLLLSMTGLDMGEWQVQSAKWAIGIFIIFIVVPALLGTVPIMR